METRRVEVETPRSRDRETSAFYGPHQGRGFRCLLAANTDKVSALALSTEEYFCGQLDKNSRRAGAGPNLVRAVSLLLLLLIGRLENSWAAKSGKKQGYTSYIETKTISWPTRRLAFEFIRRFFLLFLGWG